jgi:hypothetical protein
MISSNLLNVIKVFKDSFSERILNLAPVPPINDGDEHLVVLRRTGADVDLFVDGVLISSYPMSSAQLEIDSDIRIGRSHFDGFDFNGTIRNFQVYDYALTTPEIVSLYELG